VAQLTDIANSLWDFVNKTGLKHHNKCEAVSVLKSTKIISNKMYQYLFYLPQQVLKQKTSHQTVTPHEEDSCTYAPCSAPKPQQLATNAVTTIQRPAYG
jgi:hypothetical protein